MRKSLTQFRSKFRYVECSAIAITMVAGSSLLMKYIASEEARYRARYTVAKMDAKMDANMDKK